MKPQDLLGFALGPFFDLMGMGFECVAWVSLVNLFFFFTSFLILFMPIDTEFGFLQMGALLSDGESQFLAAYKRE